jgi:hypothetical protein
VAPYVFRGCAGGPGAGAARAVAQGGKVAWQWLGSVDGGAGRRDAGWLAGWLAGCGEGIWEGWVAGTKRRCVGIEVTDGIEVKFGGRASTSSMEA